MAKLLLGINIDYIVTLRIKLGRICQSAQYEACC